MTTTATPTQWNWKRGELGSVLRARLGNAAGVYQDLTGATSCTVIGRLQGTTGAVFSVACSIPASVTYPAIDGWIALTLDATLAVLTAGTYEIEFDVILAGGILATFPNDGVDTVVVRDSMNTYP